MSNELKVTGGEWFIRDESDEPLEITSLSRKGRISICEVAVGYEGPVEVEQQANARLLAASKKLYEALLLIEPTGDFTGWENKDGEDVGKKINAALAAARGESQ